MVNIREGLERINTVWWGFWGAMAVALFVLSWVAPFWTGRGTDFELVFLSLGAAVACLIGHRVGRWIIRGFFPVLPNV